MLILMLHHVSDEDDILPLTLSPALLEEVLREVKAHHDVVDIEQVVRDGRVVAPAALAVAVTFDDGYRDNYDRAFPILAKLGVPATIYLSVDHVEGRRQFWHRRLVRMIQRARGPVLDLRAGGGGCHAIRTPEERAATIKRLNAELKACDEIAREERLSAWQRLLGAPGAADDVMLSWEMVDEMKRGGVRFGSHTLSHAILARESRQRIRQEVHESKRILEEHLGSTVAGFAYPNGTADDFNDEAVGEVRAARYKYACTTVPGINREGDDVFRLRRVNVHNDMCRSAEGAFDRALFWAKALAVF